MTAQEIIREIQKLPPIERKRILDSVEPEAQKIEISEIEVARHLLANGIINEIPKYWNEADEEFEPIDIKGKPFSETIIEDRI